jgi:hypothetical protein
MTRLLRKCGACLLAVVVCAAGLVVETGAGTTTFTVDAATLQNFLSAVTPYEFVVGQGGLSETLRLANPRDIKFENGKVKLKIDCRGEPFPLELVLEPVISLNWDQAESAWVARIESLPVELAPLGTFNLAKYVRPVPIPSAFSQPAGDDQVGFVLDGKIRSLEILSNEIKVTADMTFRPAPPPLSASKAP